MESCIDRKCKECQYNVLDPQSELEVCVLAFNIPNRDGRGLMRGLPFDNT
ncbi:MAG: hypothetical protein ABH950_00975 [Candidatus Altiarchaeota archaeon]